MVSFRHTTKTAYTNVGSFRIISSGLSSYRDMIPFLAFKARRSNLVEKEEIASSRAEPSDLQSEPLLLTGLLLQY